MTAWPYYFGEDCGRTLELWMRRPIKYSKLGELFCESLEEMNVKRNADDAVSEGSLTVT